jgi:cell wall-associated NlpC family hydrolase
MKHNNWILGLVFLIGFSAFSQEKYTKHTVAKGETIIKIAQQYHIKTSAIYELNPEARKGIKFKSTLLIPSSAKEIVKTTNNPTAKYTQKTHAVLPKETIYGIAKQYDVSVAELYKVNPTLEKSGLRKGEKITIPVAEADVVAVTQNTVSLNTTQKGVLASSNLDNTTISNAAVVREVLPNETKYAIAREYGISVADIDAANPVVASEPLKIGQQLIIPSKIESKVNSLAVIAQTNNQEVKGNKPNTTEKTAPFAESAIVSNAVVDTDNGEIEVVREVQAKETKYGIAKEYGISVAELEKQNPKIKNGLPVGYQLNIRGKKPTDSKSAFVVKDVITNPNVDTNYDVKAFHGTDFLDQLVSTASENIGTRYRSGGTTKEGFDCSGLMCTTFGAFDIDLPRTSLEQSQYGTKINNEDAQKGDLIFFKTNGRRQVNHVGMVVEVSNGDIKFIHASTSNGVIISSIKEKYYSKRVTQINRVL